MDMLWQDSSFGRVGDCLNLVERKWSVLGVSGSTLKVEKKNSCPTWKEMTCRPAALYFIYIYIIYQTSRVESNILTDKMLIFVHILLK